MSGNVNECVKHCDPEKRSDGNIAKMGADGLKIVTDGPYGKRQEHSRRGCPTQKCQRDGRYGTGKNSCDDEVA